MEWLKKFYALPYGCRWGAVVLLMVFVAGIERLCRGRAARRWKEYSFWMACGTLGGLIGAGIDGMTCQISPEYFLIGKGLSGVAGDFRLLWVKAIELGFQAGFLFGILAGGVLLMANNPKGERASLPYSRLARALVYPVAGGLLCAWPLGEWAQRDWLGLSSVLNQVLEPEAIGRFLRVQGLHAGVYLGGGMGTVVAVLQVRRERGCWVRKRVSENGKTQILFCLGYSIDRRKGEDG